jgi:hypothetical protein
VVVNANCCAGACQHCAGMPQHAHTHLAPASNQPQRHQDEHTTSQGLQLQQGSQPHTHTLKTLSHSVGQHCMPAHSCSRAGLQRQQQSSTSWQHTSSSTASDGACLTTHTLH